MGSTYSATLTATGGTAPFTWSLASGTLPAGLTLSTSGIISGKPSASGTSSFSVTVKDAESTPQAVSSALKISIAAAVTTPTVTPLQLISSSLASGTVGSTYSATLTATGGTSPYTWSVASGTLPAGLTLSTSGTISGKPSTSGTSSFSVTVKDAESTPQAVTSALQISIAAAVTTPTVTPLQLTSSSLASGTVGSAYSATLTATGGTSPYTWSVASGSLPAGLTLSTSGAITGTPSASGASSFSLTVKDSASSPQAATSTFSLTIAAAASATGAVSASNYVNIVNGQSWPLNFVPFCIGAGQECPWNNPLPDSPTLMSNSASMISGLFGSSGGMTGLPDGGQSGSNDFSHPVYLAASTDPLVTIGSGCGTSAGITGTQIHIPAQARPTTSSDAHMGVIQPNGDEYDFWDVTNPAGNWTTGSTLHCSESGAYSNIVTASGSLTYSATSGAALSAGNLRANELQNGVISHALFVVIPSSNGYVYPGTANAAQGGSIPIGARVQLKWTDAQIDAMTGQAAWEKTLLHQLHDYGLYVLDTGGDGYLTYKWESSTQFTSFGGTSPAAAWDKTNNPPATWKPAGINWSTDLIIVDPCYAEGSC